MSSQQSRTIIRTHHRLQKKHAAAIKTGDTTSAEKLALEIEENGGIELYQAASKQGQSKDRGGDSSKVLVEWIRHNLKSTQKQTEDNEGSSPSPYRCLEVGALSMENEISKFPRQIAMTRIDLNSQGPGIEKQDFMKRPLPTNEDESFDIISLSLVLNYVPDAPERGEMLKRVTQFFRTSYTEQGHLRAKMPLLFFVLPLPCVENSRYLDETLLLQIMSSLGFVLVNRKSTPKLCYYLFSMTGVRSQMRFQKRKVRDGATMNNFCIIVN